MNSPIKKFRAQLSIPVALTAWCLLLGVQVVSAQDGDSTPHAAALDEGNGSLGGSIFEDANGNGVVDEGEASAQGVEISLLGEDSKVIATVVSGESGAYEFTGLKPGVYILRFAFTPDFVVRSTGIVVEDGETVDFTVPVITPGSRYNFVRLRLVNPATASTNDPVTEFQP